MPAPARNRKMASCQIFAGPHCRSGRQSVIVDIQAWRHNMRHLEYRALACLVAATALCQTASKSDEAPAVSTAGSAIERIVIVRLKNGTDMLEGLRQAVAR